MKLARGLALALFLSIGRSAAGQDFTPPSLPDVGRAPAAVAAPGAVLPRAAILDGAPAGLAPAPSAPTADAQARFASAVGNPRLPAQAPAEAQVQAQAAPFDGSLKAGFLEGLTVPHRKTEIYHTYVVPNERHPEDARGILEQAPEGVYATVGNERGFLAAALAPKVTRLLLVDRDPQLKMYSQINIALLQLARDREEYRRLRLSSSAQEWRRLALERPLPAASRQALTGIGRWDFWKETQLYNPMYEGSGEFRGSNYLLDDALFARLKSLADRQAIAAVELDLTDAAGVRRLVDAVKAEGQPLSVLDLSNAWEEGYIGQAATRAAARAFSELASPQALFLVTRRAGYQFAGEGGGTTQVLWKYVAFRFADLFSAERGENGVDTIYRNMSRYRRNRINPVDPPPTAAKRFGAWLGRLWRE